MAIASAAKRVAASNLSGDRERGEAGQAGRRHQPESRGNLNPHPRLRLFELIGQFEQQRLLPETR